MEKFKSGKRSKLIKEIHYITYEELEDDILKESTKDNSSIKLKEKQDNNQDSSKVEEKLKRRREN